MKYLNEKRDLKISKTFKGSTESRKALEKLKSTDKVMDPLTKIRTEAGFVQLIQDLVKTMIDNEGMQMSPSRTFDALDRVKRSFEVKNESLIREYIRELILESDPATTGTEKTVEKIIDKVSKGSLENVKKKISGVFKPNTDSNKQERPIDGTKPKIGTDNNKASSSDKMSDASTAIAKNPKVKRVLNQALNKSSSQLNPEEIALVASLKNVGNQNGKEEKTSLKGDDSSQKDSQTSTNDGTTPSIKLKNA